MELCSPDAAPFFLGLHHIRIFGSLHRRDLGCHFSGLRTGQKHRQQGKQHGPKEDHRRSADGGDACIQLDGLQDNRHQNSADAVAQQQPRRNADQTKQKCLLANDAFELPGRCANGFQKSVKPDIPCNRDLKNVMKKNKFEFIIDSEFQSQIPALTDEEFQQLEENILSEGEVLSPLIVWGNILVDGHNRYKILQQHPEIPYTTRSISCTCETREDVLAWICKHQLGRRNLTPEQKKFLIGKQYHSEKSTRGGNHGNQYTQVANYQIDNLPSVENTTERIAKENNVSPSFVIRAEQFMKTVELMEKYCPGIQEEILSGKLKLSQREATIIRGTPTEALPTVVSTWREEKLNGKPDDSADIYENSELLSKVAENNFSTAATSKIQTADPLSENRPFISSGKRSTELQTIRQLGEKMATVDHVADAEGMFTEINGASESFMFRIDQCFARYPDFLANVELEAKVIATLQKAEDYILHLKEQHHQHLLEATNRQ